MAQLRSATAHWSGDLDDGGGAVSAVSSGVIAEAPITWRARTEEAGGMTSPEELLAAAHAACYSMAVSNELSKAGYPPERVEVSVGIEADKATGGWTVLTSRISLRARVPGIDEETFHQKAEAAKGGCPISRVMAGNVDIELQATLLG